MRHLVPFLALLFAAAGQASAQPADEAARIAWALERGRLLFELDRAVWVGTDDMLARVRNPADSGLRGYIVQREGTGFAVTFYGGPAEAPIAHYRGRVENREIVSREIFPADARPLLTPVERRLAAARDLGPTSGRRPCGDRPFNTVVVPPETPDGPIDLYLLTPQVREGEFPLGGHYRVTIDADGSVGSSRAFTNSCLLMPRQEGAAAMFVTHLLDTIPTEIHVFTSMTSGVPVGVGTSNPDRVWWVTEDAIRQIEDPRRAPRS